MAWHDKLLLNVLKKLLLYSGCTFTNTLFRLLARFSLPKKSLAPAREPAKLYFLPKARRSKKCSVRRISPKCKLLHPSKQTGSIIFVSSPYRFHFAGAWKALCSVWKPRPFFPRALWYLRQCSVFSTDCSIRVLFPAVVQTLSLHKSVLRPTLPCRQYWVRPLCAVVRPVCRYFPSLTNVFRWRGTGSPYCRGQWNWTPNSRPKLSASEFYTAI